MRWVEVDIDLAIWIIPETKNGDSLVVPLGPDAIDILKRRQLKMGPDAEFVFPGYSAGGHYKYPDKAWHRLKKRANIKDLRIHDLCRTLASYMAIHGESLVVIGWMLGHKDQRSTAIYAKLIPDPVKEAAEKQQRRFILFGGLIRMNLLGLIRKARRPPIA